MAVALGVGSGIGFGVMAVLLGFTSEESGVWPALATRLIAAGTLAVGGLAMKRPHLPHAHTWKFIVPAAVLASVGIALFTLSAQRDVTIAPFWMGKCEVTWDQYDAWGEEMDQLRRKMLSIDATPRDEVVDGFSKGPQQTCKNPWINSPPYPLQQKITAHMNIHSPIVISRLRLRPIISAPLTSRA